jgi:hypothetical protein
MSQELPNRESPTIQLRSGLEIVTDFVASLKENKSLDADTVAAVEDLLAKGKLTFTNLLKSLEDLRGKSSI